MRNRSKNPFDPIPQNRAHHRQVHVYAGKRWGYEGEPETEHAPLTPVRSAVSQRRFSYFSLFGFAILVILFVRLATLQVARGEELRTAAEENRIRIHQISAPRGVIYDRNGTALVQNIPNETLLLTPSDLPKGEQLRQIVAQLAPLLDVPADSLMDEVAAKVTPDSKNVVPRVIVLREHLSYESALKIRLFEKELTGFSIEDTSTREYLGGNAFSHVLGYTGKITAEQSADLLNEGYQLTDQIGKSGLELSYEQVLRGKNGREQIEVDSRGKAKRVIAAEPSVLGKNLYLSIDADLQRRASDSLESMMRSSHSHGGALVAIDPRNGEILAMVSAPGFDNNLFTSKSDPAVSTALLSDPLTPLFNRAVAGQYPSGSTIKPFVASAALNEHVITEHTTVNSTGGIHIGKWFFPDWQSGGHGITDVRKALAQSVNTFFYTIGGGTDTFTGLGVTRLVAALEKFGLGKATGIDLHGEANGLLPTPEWKERVKRENWYIGDTYHLAIGQGDLLVTPLQMAVATAAVANGGTVYRPRLVTTIVTPDGTRQEVAPSPIGNASSDAESLRIVREGMREGVLSGSARSLQSLPVTSAGKTGTAQFGDGSKTHAWFTTFAPYENPEIVLAVVLDGGGEGHASALPVAKDVLQWYFSHTHPVQQ